LRGQKQLVADSDTDGFIADIESHNPHIFHDTIIASTSVPGGFI
jgi:hypothetical protein